MYLISPNPKFSAKSSVFLPLGLILYMPPLHMSIERRVKKVKKGVRDPFRGPSFLKRVPDTLFRTLFRFQAAKKVTTRSLRARP